MEHLQIAVLFKEIKRNEEIIKGKKQLYKTLNEFNDYTNIHFAKKTITCLNCKSSINEDYFKGSECPVCGSNLKFIKNSFEEMRAKVDKAEKEFEEVKNNPKNYNLKWLIKYEYLYQE